MGRVRLSVPTDAADHPGGPGAGHVPGSLSRRRDRSVGQQPHDRRDRQRLRRRHPLRRHGARGHDRPAALRRHALDRRRIAGLSRTLRRRAGASERPARHRCIRIRIGDDSIYRWEFERGDEHLPMAVPAVRSSSTTAAWASRRQARRRPDVCRRRPWCGKAGGGELRTVLDDWVQSGPASTSTIPAAASPRRPPAVHRPGSGDAAARPLIADR
jgi:hypothetical protein